MTTSGADGRVAITYCTQCQWLLRAAWMAQELLGTFGQDLGEVALVPGTGGIFRITVDDELIWDRTEQGGFPDITVLKQLVRDRVAPDRHLGHSDRKSS
ncbi:selenoprotein W-related protein [Rhodococcus percolatus]|uniref:SelT/SelW/SelH family protein n=1 Tax=Rhodococcus opacus TaxID=37919 RepID=UPI0015FC05D6|nr:SelT/SelW/SelH family protein [Rhodococcus opacus]MBA8959264.1 selenoprotein W-related protein [Rhodococcus opacus]MBP2204829.1 selenoprotein W-related protein [Rhodococcus opacus]